MGFVQGEGRTQGSLFPVTLEELIPDDHVCRVIDAFVERLEMAELGFERAEAAETGRPGYDPRDLLKLYLYGYLQQIRSSRRLEGECRRNVELMWLLGRLTPDHKTIAEFRRMHREAVAEAGGELIQFARQVGLVRGEWVAIDGSKFRAVSSARQRTRARGGETLLGGTGIRGCARGSGHRSAGGGQRAGEVAAASGSGSAFHAYPQRQGSGV